MASNFETLEAAIEELDQMIDEGADDPTSFLADIRIKAAEIQEAANALTEEDFEAEYAEGEEDGDITS